MMMINQKRGVIVPRTSDGTTTTDDAGDDSARIDKVSNAEDKIRKAREYAAALAKAKADKDAEKKSDDKAESSSSSSGGDKKPEEYVPPAKKEVTVSILTRDNEYNPFDEDESVVGFETDEAVYKPSVSTWVVFERRRIFQRRTAADERFEKRTSRTRRRSRRGKREWRKSWQSIERMPVC